MKKTHASVIVLLAFLISTTITPTIIPCAKAQTNPNVYLTVTPSSCEQGYTFDVSIYAQQPAGGFDYLWAWQAGLEWPTGSLLYVSSAWGDLASAAWPNGPPYSEYENITSGPKAATDASSGDTGLLFLESVVQGGGPSPSVGVTQWSGDLLLLTVTFQATENVGSNPASAPIDLLDVRLISRDPNTLTPPGPPFYTWPDVNNDGKVDMKDVVLTLRNWLSGLNSPNTDFDGDGIVDVMDVAIVCSDFGTVAGGSGWGYTNVMSDITGTLSGGSVTITPNMTPPQPTTTLTASGTLVDGWYTSPVTVTLTATDLWSVVAQTDYSFNGITWYTYSGPFTVTNEGTTTVYYYSTDNAGNVEPTKSYTIGIDESPPVIAVSSPAAGTTYPHSGTLQVVFSATDADSGVNSVTAVLGPDPDPQVYIDPSAVSGYTNVPFTVNVMVSDVADLFAWQLDISFDPNMLQCNNVVIPPDNVFAGESWLTPPGVRIDNNAGTLLCCNCLLDSEPTYTNVGGADGILCAIEFTPIDNAGNNPTTTPISIITSTGETFLLDSNLNEIPSLTAASATFTFNQFTFSHDVAVLGVTASPNVVVAGDTVTITVEVQNRGTNAETFDVTACYDQNVIGTLHETNLGADGQTDELTFTWDTTGILPALYQISAYAYLSSDQDLSDNSMQGGQVAVMIPVANNQVVDLSTLDPGSYVLTVTATDNVGNTAVSSASFTVGSNTLAGSTVVTIPDVGLTVTFNTVTADGTTQAATTNVGPSPPAGFNLGNPPAYYEITSTATYTTPISVAISYDPQRFTNQALKLYQWDSGTSQWVDVTAHVDTTNHIIYSIGLSHLSVFAVTEPNVRVTPAFATFDVGQSQLFTSTVTGVTSPFTYQWYLNGTAISDATNATWTFTPTLPGFYTVYLEATDPANNTSTSNSVSVTVNIHDVAITNVASSKTVVFQGSTMNINATAADLGSYTETFNVTAYANATIIASQNVTLNSGGSTTLTFNWNTTGFAKGYYTISAYAWPVPGETNTANNNFTDGFAYVSMVGDLTGTTLFVPDGKCDGRDITIVAKCFGSKLGDARYNPNCDILNRGKIDGRDITIVAKNFGKHDP
jgi:hypothetical protein